MPGDQIGPPSADDEASSPHGPPLSSLNIVGGDYEVLGGDEAHIPRGEAIRMITGGQSMGHGDFAIDLGIIEVHETGEVLYRDPDQHQFHLIGQLPDPRDPSDTHWQDQSETLLGATPPESGERKIVIPGEFISRRHARITIRDGEVYIQDAGATNGLGITRFPANYRDQRAQGMVLDSHATTANLGLFLGEHGGNTRVIRSRPNSEDIQFHDIQETTGRVRSRIEALTPPDDYLKLGATGSIPIKEGEAAQLICYGSESEKEAINLGVIEVEADGTVLYIDPSWGKPQVIGHMSDEKRYIHIGREPKLNPHPKGGDPKRFAGTPEFAGFVPSICVQDEFVSGRHAFVHIDKGHVRVSNDHSRNGLAVTKLPLSAKGTKGQPRWKIPFAQNAHLPKGIHRDDKKTRTLSVRPPEHGIGIYGDILSPSRKVSEDAYETLSPDGVVEMFQGFAAQLITSVSDKEALNLGIVEFRMNGDVVYVDPRTNEASLLLNINDPDADFDRTEDCTLTIGRTEEDQDWGKRVVIPNDFVSGLHVQIRINGGIVYIDNCEASNGLAVNLIPLDQRAKNGELPLSENALLPEERDGFPNDAYPAIQLPDVDVQIDGLSPLGPLDPDDLDELDEEERVSDRYAILEEGRTIEIPAEKAGIQLISNGEGKLAINLGSIEIWGDGTAVYIGLNRDTDRQRNILGNVNTDTVTFQLGSAASNDIIIDDPNVAAHHAEIKLEDGKMVIVGGHNLDEIHGLAAARLPLKKRKGSLITQSAAYLPRGILPNDGGHIRWITDPANKPTFSHPDPLILAAQSTAAPAPKPPQTPPPAPRPGPGLIPVPAPDPDDPDETNTIEDPFSVPDDDGGTGGWFFGVDEED